MDHEQKYYDLKLGIKIPPEILLYYILHHDQSWGAQIAPSLSFYNYNAKFPDLLTVMITINL